MYIVIQAGNEELAAGHVQRKAYSACCCTSCIVAMLREKRICLFPVPAHNRSRCAVHYDGQQYVLLKIKKLSRNFFCRQCIKVVLATVS